VCAFGTQQEMQEANMLRRWWRVGVRGQMIWLIVLCTVGCQPDKYRDEADEQVYSILDEKWQGDFGSRTDYQLRDNEPNSQEILAGSTQPAQMSLAEAVRMATANNRDYQTQKEQMYLVGLGLTGARHDFEAQPFATLSGGYAKGAADESVGLGGQGGVNLLLASGAQISTSLAVDWLRFLTGDARTSLGSVLAATVRQPLLQGAGRRVVMENLTQAERDTFYAIRSFNRFRKEFVVSVVTDYYRVLQQLDRVANEQNNYRRLQVAAEQTRMLAEAGRLPPVQADQAEQAELDGKNSYVRAQQSYQQVLDAFKLQLSLPTAATIALDPNELAALETTDIDVPAYDMDQLVQTALEQRLDLANVRDQVDDAERQVYLAENGLLPRVDLVASANAASEAPTEAAKIRFDQGDYELGFDADLNVDKLDERNAYRQSLIALARRRRAYTQTRDQTEFEVRQAYRDLREAADVYAIQQMSLKLAAQRVDSTTELVQAGRADVRDLLEAQRSLLSAQNARTNALVDFTLARLDFLRDLGALKVQPDGLWDEASGAQIEGP